MKNADKRDGVKNLDISLTWYDMVMYAPPELKMPKLYFFLFAPAVPPRVQTFQDELRGDPLKCASRPLGLVRGWELITMYP